MAIAFVGIAGRDDDEVADAAVEHPPQLVTGDARGGEPLQPGGLGPALLVDARTATGGQHARQVALDAAARHVAHGADVDRVEQRRHLGRVDAGRHQQVGLGRVVAEHAPDQREAVGVRPAGGEADDHVAALDPPAVDQPVLRHLADAEAGDVQVVVGHHAGMLGRLAAQQRAAGLAAAVGDALHQRGDALGIDAADRDVVEEEQRLRAGAEHVVDAHRDAVDAGRVQRAAALVQDSFVPTPSVPATSSRSPRSNSPANPPCDSTTPGRRVRTYRCGQPPDDRLGGIERDAGGGVRVLRHPTGAASKRNRPPSRSSSGIVVG